MVGEQGSVIGGWPLLPWAFEVSGAKYSDTLPGQIKFGNVFTFNYWVRWFTEPFGLTLQYSLERDFEDFLRYPLLDGRPTYLMAAVHSRARGRGDIPFSAVTGAAGVDRTRATRRILDRLRSEHDAGRLVR